MIIVDDCSTDNSRAVVESYAEKFGGRLLIGRTSENSGGCAVPRNVGLPFSCAEYLFFMDGDDLITPTALEELYLQAKKFDADVVHCDKFYQISDEFTISPEFRKILKPMNYLPGDNTLLKEPCIWKNNFEERINFFTQRKLCWNVWLQLVRREFFMDNKLRFCDIYAEDMIFTICALCCAANYVVVPNVIYFYRIRQDSISTGNVEVQNKIHRQIKALKCGIRYLDEFFCAHEFFSERPYLKYALFNTFVQEMLGHLNAVYAQIPAYALDELVRQEFGEDSVLETFIFNIMNVQRLQLLKTQYQFNQLAAQIRQQ